MVSISSGICTCFFTVFPGKANVCSELRLAAMEDARAEADAELRAFVQHCNDGSADEATVDLLKRRLAAINCDQLPSEKLKEVAGIIRRNKANGVRALVLNAMSNASSIALDDWTARVAVFTAVLQRHCLLIGDVKRATDTLTAVKFAVNGRDNAIGTGIAHSASIPLHVELDPDPVVALHECLQSSARSVLMAISPGGSLPQSVLSVYSACLPIPASQADEKSNDLQFEPQYVQNEHSCRGEERHQATQKQQQHIFSMQAFTLPKAPPGHAMPLNLPLQHADALHLRQVSEQSVYVPQPVHKAVSEAAGYDEHLVSRLLHDMKVACFLSFKTEAERSDCLLLACLLPQILLPLFTEPVGESNSDERSILNAPELENLLRLSGLQRLLQLWQDTFDQLNRGESTGEQSEELLRSVIAATEVSMNECTDRQTPSFLAGLKHVLILHVLKQRLMQAFMQRCSVQPSV